MARPEPNDLIHQIQSKSLEDFRLQEQANFLKKYSSSEVLHLLDIVQNKLIHTHTGLLEKGIRSAWAGALYAFFDRDLDPFHPDHFEIFELIVGDIEKAYLFVSQGNIDPGLWAYETFDYGIKQVYYLDWKLYLSKICY
jgi:hypothetical protein